MLPDQICVEMQIKKQTRKMSLKIKKEKMQREHVVNELFNVCWADPPVYWGGGGNVGEDRGEHSAADCPGRVYQSPQGLHRRHRGGLLPRYVSQSIQFHKYC